MPTDASPVIQPTRVPALAASMALQKVAFPVFNAAPPVAHVCQKILIFVYPVSQANI